LEDRPSQELLAQWQYAVSEIESKFLQHLKLISYLSIRYEMEAGLSPVILKGLGLAAYYPQPNHRYAGDIDMYFGGKAASEKIDQLVTRWGAKVEGGEDNVETVFVMSGVVLENHKVLIESSNPFISRRTRRDLENKIQAGTIFRQTLVEKTPIKVLVPIYNHLLLLTHSLKHVLNAGIGFRQLCDVAMLLRSERNLDGKALRQLLKEWGIYRWACLVYAFCVEYLGTAVTNLPFTFNLQDYRPDILLQEVWKSGNFGQMDQRMAQRAPGGDSVFTAKRIYGNAWRFLKYAPGDAIGLPLEYTFGYIKKKIMH